MRSPRLLVADGDAGGAAGLARVAKSLNFSVRVVPDGEAFQAGFDLFDPDIVAFEIFLREVDGLELLDWLSQRGEVLPVIMFTARGERYLRTGRNLAELRGLPSVHTLSKPLRRVTMIHALHKALEDTSIGRAEAIDATVHGLSGGTCGPPASTPIFVHKGPALQRK